MDTLINDSEVKIYPNPNTMSLALADDFMQRSTAVLQKKNAFSVALSGGTTPKLLFDTLSSTKKYYDKIDWSKIKFFFGDERYLPINDPNTNYAMANSSLFSKLPIPAENIYRIPTEPMSSLDAALEYESILKDQLELNSHGFPEFDLVYLGIGEDAHTASLMPHSNIVKYYSQADKSFYPDNNHDKHDNAITTNLVVAAWVQKLNMYRITLTPIVINNALNVIFIASGMNKAAAVHNVLEGNYEPENYPAQLIRCINNKNIWYLDESAASQLSIRN